MSSDEPLPPPVSLGRSLNFATGATNPLCNARLAQHGLSLPQWVILSALWREDGQTVKQIARYTSTAMPAVSRILDRMEQAGLLSRRPDPDDRRAIRVYLEPKGRGLDHLNGFHTEMTSLLLEGFSARERDQFFDFLARVETRARTAAQG